MTREDAGLAEVLDPELDLEVTRVIAAPRAAVWQAWADPRRFEQWWVPAPARCRVAAMELRPGGAFETLFSEDGEQFVPQITGCILDVEEGRRLVFTTALVAGWRPAAQPFITAEFTFEDHPEGTFYRARAMHKDPADRKMHEELGFFDGWGTVTRQLAQVVER
ncbi:SRPBCC family protein [Herbiconiux liukaitaii]|uniref:SRPBCC family protein n=1 Tax=Herbiconiux liukaitaii TaxID=3342799 RepID=UPI0035B7D0EE